MPICIILRKPSENFKNIDPTHKNPSENRLHSQKKINTLPTERVYPVIKCLLLELGGVYNYSFMIITFRSTLPGVVETIGFDFFIK